MHTPPIHHHFHRLHATRPATWPHKITLLATSSLTRPLTNAGISTFWGMHPPTTTNHHFNPPLARTFTTLRHRHIAPTISPQVLHTVTNMSPLCHPGQTRVRHRLDKWYQLGMDSGFMGNFATTRLPPHPHTLATEMQRQGHRTVSGLSPHTYWPVTVFTHGITLVYN